MFSLLDKYIKNVIIKIAKCSLQKKGEIRMVNFLKSLFGKSEELQILEWEINVMKNNIKNTIKNITSLLYVLDYNLSIFERYVRLLFEVENNYYYGEIISSLNDQKCDLKEASDRTYELEIDIKNQIVSQKSEEWENIFNSIPEGESLSFTSVEDGEYFLWYKKVSENEFQKLMAGNMTTLNNIYDQGILTLDEVVSSSSVYFLDCILGKRKYEITKDPLTLRK